MQWSTAVGFPGRSRLTTKSGAMWNAQAFAAKVAGKQDAKVVVGRSHARAIGGTPEAAIERPALRVELVEDNPDFWNHDHGAAARRAPVIRPAARPGRPCERRGH